MIGGIILVNVRKVIVGFYLVLFLVLCVSAGVFFWQTRAEYRRLQKLEEQSRKRLAEVEARLREQEKILERLRNDPAYVERVIRRDLYYAKPDEYIFRFDH